ncbi:Melanopsin [Crenichthys baileyi]|uniref:Melanopsin n=1 Tax=Crenichthys baileyi TaxID=28760 RepID=A0AAV9RSI2_9TELE
MASDCPLAKNCTGHQKPIGMPNVVHLPGPVPTHNVLLQPRLFPTVDVPVHAHYIIGSVILLVGVTGMLGNALVIYVFCRSETLRSPSNLLVVNLAVADFLMSVTQSPVFFVASLHRRWVFGEFACELYAFCGALFGISSMMTLTAISLDRCLAITRPLALLGGVSRRRLCLVTVGVWVYSVGWSLPPFFGWSAYIPEGLQTSCSWDYMSFTVTVRTYTLLLFFFVFFIPLAVIAIYYLSIFRAVRRAAQEVEKLNCGEINKAYERLRSEWRMARVALGVILLFIMSWSPYSAVALTATAGYAHLLTPYMNSVPAINPQRALRHPPTPSFKRHPPPNSRAAIGRHFPSCFTVLRPQDGGRYAPSHPPEAPPSPPPPTLPQLARGPVGFWCPGQRTVEKEPAVLSFRQRPCGRGANPDGSNTPSRFNHNPEQHHGCCVTFDLSGLRTRSVHLQNQPLPVGDGGHDNQSLAAAAEEEQAVFSSGDRKCV